MTLSLAAAAAPAQPNSFRGIGSLPEGTGASSAQAVSADGLSVAGMASTAEPGAWRAMRWRAGGGMINLGSVPSHLNGQVVALTISGDGAAVAGRLWNTPPNTFDAFLWTEHGGMTLLGHLNPANPNTRGQGISGDGSVVVGSSGAHAFRWTHQTGMVSLGSLPGIGQSNGFATGVSADGAVVTGSSQSAHSPFNEAFRWTAETGMVGLGLDGGNLSRGNAISTNGQVIVGEVSGFNQNNQYITEAFRWTESTGIVRLGHMPQRPEYSSAQAVSGDGSVIVGIGRGSWIWDEDRGMRSLDIAFTEAGLDFSRWTLETVFSISADGRTVVGSGLNPEGRLEGWIAVVPAPPTAVSLSLVALAGRRRRGC